MVSGNAEAFLRVLYTVNTSPQYILAKTLHKIPFTPIECASSSNSSSKHGCASVRACAMAICRSSPELRPDATKDFSIYILDPLEELMSRSRHGQSNGVAVAMGLLSSILSPYTPDSNMVTGTLVSCGQDEDALEVVVSLKQVAPPVMHALDDQSRGVLGLSEAKPTINPPSHDQPYYTSSPRPLPSLDERLFSSYALPQQNNSQSSRSKEPRRPNPTHFTRAHQLPTPYIGPPKRKYTRESTQIKDRATSVLEDLSAGMSSDRRNVEHFSDPSSSQLSTSDCEASQPSFTHACLPGGTSNLSQAMLAALSTVTPKSSDREPIQPSQGNARPSPELIAFCQAIIAHHNAQQLSPDMSGNISSHLPSHQATSPSTTVQESAADRGAGVQDQDRGQHRPDDKENQSPQMVVPSSKDSNPDKPTGTSPLGSGRFNARSSINQLSSALDMSEIAPASSSTTAPNYAYSRKRKLSDAALSQPNSQSSAQVGKRCISSSKVKETVEDLSGVRVNSGWGGLRIRSDGRLWGEHLPQSSTSFPSSISSTQLGKQGTQQPALFRSSGSTSSVPIRRGPYVVPDWAKGVPPPAAPPRRDLSDEDRDRDRVKERKQSKSKGLRRLGGKSVVKRAASLKKSTDGLTTPPRPVSPSLNQSQNDLSTQTGSYTPPKESPRRLPIFAYSSPGGMSGVASLFQAFQTSPCRPTSVRKNMFSTPLRPATTSPGCSAKRSSLFTPSPATAKAESEFKPRRLFTEEDAPPSPTPTKKRSASPRLSLEQQDITSSSSPKPSIDSRNEGHTDCPSSLPIASSDDFLDDNTSAQPPSVSSDSTVTNLSKIHDWSSLDLPPSSPPPPSSPSIVPTEGSDLPCSDIPSSDISEVESPPVIFDFDSSYRPSPAQDEGQTTHGALGFDLSQASTNESMSGSFLADQFPPFSVTGEEGPSSIPTFEALQNDLGQEDLSEVWNVLNSLCHRSSSIVDGAGDEAFDMGDWLIPSSDPAPVSHFNASLTDVADIFEVGSGSEMYIGDTRASKMATNFADLLEGCIV